MQHNEDTTDEFQDIFADEDTTDDFQDIFADEPSPIPTLQDIFEKGWGGIIREKRPTQYQLAQDIQALLSCEKGSVHLAEGGTGVGKSFAYLIPAILSGKRVIVSTATNNLQHQLIHDLNTVLKPLTDLQETKVLLYKGNNHYACPLLSKNIEDPNERELFEDWVDHHLNTLKVPADKENWLPEEWPEWWPEDEPLPQWWLDKKEPDWWREVTTDSCAYKRNRNKCKVFPACKPQPKKAQMLIVNHTLTAIDLFMSSDDCWLFDKHSLAIIDEAHNFAESCRDQLTTKLGHGILSSLQNYSNTNSKFQTLIDETGAYDIEDPAAISFQDTRSRPTISHAQIDKLLDTAILKHNKFLNLLRPYKRLTGIKEVIASHMIHTTASNILPPLETLTRLIGLVDYVATQDYEKKEKSLSDEDKKKKAAELSTISYFGRRIKTLQKNLEVVCAATAPDTQENYTITKDSKKLYISYLYIGKRIEESFSRRPFRVYTSATLRTYPDDDFKFFKDSVGLPLQRVGLTGKDYPSPFNYRTNAGLWVPYTMPFFNADSATCLTPTELAAAELQVPLDLFERRMGYVKVLIEEAEGGVLVLFTSRADRDNAAIWLEQRLDPRKKINLLVQGTKTVSKIQQEFKDTPRSVILGLKSFWEGVDFPGPDLRLVIIFKLPFPYHGHVNIKAQRKLAGLQKKSKFLYVDLPIMLINLRQQAGRLIRTLSDSGAVVILDNRLWFGGYPENETGDSPPELATYNKKGYADLKVARSNVQLKRLVRYRGSVQSALQLPLLRNKKETMRLVNKTKPE